MAVNVAFISETERILATYVTITISIGKTLGDVIVQSTFEPSELKVARPLSQLSKYAPIHRRSREIALFTKGKATWDYKKN